jgi:peptide/nickel transport system substrate-binding protein
VARTRREIVATISALLLEMAACTTDTGGSDGVAADAADQPLRIGSVWEITSVDPLTEGYWAEVFAYGELLLRPTPSGEPEPWVLKSAETVSPTEWELEVNEGVSFQNGSPCDAEAVAALINHQLAENALLKPILPGALAEATGPTTLTLTTKSPVSIVPNLLTHDDLFPVYDVEAYKANEGDGETFVGAGLYTGPYEVTELNAEHLVLERYEDYWQGTPALPGVEVKFIADHQARVLAVQSGEVDIALYPPTESAGTLEDSAHYMTAEHGTNGPRLIFNMRKPPIDDVLVRRALSAAVNYEAITNDVMDGYYDVAQGLFPAVMPFAVANQVHDPDEARALLDQAGWTDSGEGTRSKDGRPLELTLVTYRTDPDMQPIAVAIRSQLQELGIAVEIWEIESSAQLYDKDFTDWHAGLILSSYYGVQGDAVGVVLQYLTSDGGYNSGGLADPEIDALAEEMVETFDQERRYDLFHELQEIVIAEKAYTIVPAEKRIPAVVSNAWSHYRPSENYLWADGAATGGMRMPSGTAQALQLLIDPRSGGVAAGPGRSSPIPHCASSSKCSGHKGTS